MLFVKREKPTRIRDMINNYSRERGDKSDINWKSLKDMFAILRIVAWSVYVNKTKGRMMVVRNYLWSLKKRL